MKNLIFMSALAITLAYSESFACTHAFPYCASGKVCDFDESSGPYQCVDAEPDTFDCGYHKSCPYGYKCVAAQGELTIYTCVVDHKGW